MARAVLRLIGGAALAAALAATAHAQTVAIYAAGSLRQVVADLAQEAGPALGVQIKGVFGGSGSMRERIEQGEPADLMMSADMASPRKLQGEGRTTTPVIAFARNRECIVSRRTAGVTAANLIDKLLDKDIRVKTSMPVADPSGDYAWTIFDKVDTLRPGAGQTLKAKAQGLMDITAAPSTSGQSALAALFAANKIDLTISYCSGDLDKELPGLASLPVPPALDPHPVFGVAVLSPKPEALRVALYLLSEKGQAILAKDGLIPLVDPAR